MSVKGGLGVEVGRIDDTDSDEAAVVLETAAERRLGRALLGAEYDLTAGSIGGPSAPASFSRTLHGRESPGPGGRGAAASRTSGAESFTYNELSSYLKFPAGPGRASLRLSLGLPSNAAEIISETASYKWPVWRQLSLTAALTFEQGGESDVFGSLGAYWLFR